MDGYCNNIYIACLRQVVAFAPKVIKCAAYGVAQGRGLRYGRRDGHKGGVQGPLLMKEKKKGENYVVLYFTGKRFFFYIYDVIVKQK